MIVSSSPAFDLLWQQVVGGLFLLAFLGVDLLLPQVVGALLLRQLSAFLLLPQERRLACILWLPCC